MKIQNIALAGLVALTGLASCEDNLDIVNPNQQSTSDFGNKATDLEENVIACYNRIRIEGTYARVGYLLDVVAGDEVNSYSDNDWWRPYDYLNASHVVTNDDSPLHWILRDFSYTIKSCNQLLFYTEKSDLDRNSDTYKQARGQGLFIRALSYYELACYYQNVPLITDYNAETIFDLMSSTNTQDEVLDQVEKDLKEAMELLPSRDKGGEWECGRATCGAAAGYYARTLMFRHKYSEALAVLKDIIDGKYGHYELTADYGDNFRSTIENSPESLWEVQFLDYGVGGSDMEWTAANNSKSSTQGQALETVFGNGDILGWNDLAATPWLYQTFKSQRTIDGNVDPRLYWTLISYEDDYNNMDGFANMAYTVEYTRHVTTGKRMGISVAKHTTARENLYDKIAAVGLSCGVNIRLMRYSDVLLRAAECENEISGPTAQAISWINQVRSRAGLKELQLSDFPTADALFEQIANVERPTEFGCEHGRMQDIIRWGWLYNDGRLAQLRKHACTYWNDITKVGVLPESPSVANDDPFVHWSPGHEYLPITTYNLNTNPNLKGNSANSGTANTPNFNVHPVVEGIGVQ
ncbi:MAG: RagB/SusD family nutrient uptake outer membrane protein [Bacteroidales bacterium]|nr:RagB/SusD family nutrient uptake outer membrane protein [Bacteroidales bacterium]